jgi:hypothetical protein
LLFRGQLRPAQQRVIVECADEGTVTVENAQHCTLAFYIVTVSEKGNYTEYNAFAGKTTDGKEIDDEACRSFWTH